MKGRWLLDRGEGWLGKAHEFDGVGCLHEKTTSSLRGDADVIGIDYHKANSVYSVLDLQGDSLGQGRIDHHGADPIDRQA